MGEMEELDGDNYWAWRGDDRHDWNISDIYAGAVLCSRCGAFAHQTPPPPPDCPARETEPLDPRPVDFWDLVP